MCTADEDGTAIHGDLNTHQQYWWQCGCSSAEQGVDTTICVFAQLLLGYFSPWWAQ